jgi:glycosyltransferase involved in cell wall biosynthesis
MKILQFPAYISIDELKEFSRSTTGYGYMTLDIATSIANQGIEVDLLTQSNVTHGLKYKNVNILKRTWYDILFNIRLLDILNAFNVILKDHIKLNKIPNIILYNISMGYFIHILKNNHYDLVHIHGIGYYTLPIINVCKKYNVKFVVTLHGLNSFSDSINITKEEKQIEKIFLKEALDLNIPVTVISTGIKNTILNYFGVQHSKNFKIIPNACKKNNTIHDQINIREKYNIQNNTQIMLCVGNVGKRKNQIHVVRAFSLLPEKIKNNLTVLFLGYDSTNGVIQQEIDKLELNLYMKMCGCIPKEIINDFYRQADFNILASISEGFGLSIIEGFAQGLPCLTFSDIDAIPDVYHPEAIVLVAERTDNALKDGIISLLGRNWNRSFIKEYAQNFSLEKMAERYIDFFYEI